MRTALEEIHEQNMDELHAAHQAVLANPAALAVVCAVLKEEEEKRVAQERREMAAHEEREGVGSSATARAHAQGPETLHGAHEGGYTRFQLPRLPSCVLRPPHPILLGTHAIRVWPHCFLQVDIKTHSFLVLTPR